jgi:hypothetical protein
MKPTWPGIELPINTNCMVIWIDLTEDRTPNQHQLYSNLDWSDRGSNSQSTPLEASTLTSMNVNDPRSDQSKWLYNWCWLGVRSPVRSIQMTIQLVLIGSSIPGQINPNDYTGIELPINTNCIVIWIDLTGDRTPNQHQLYGHLDWSDRGSNSQSTPIVSMAKRTNNDTQNITQKTKD